MAVATSNLVLSVISKMAGDVKLKQQLGSIVKNAVGVTCVCTEQENGAATTTQANTNLRVNGLKAGRRYRVTGIIRTSNATPANGTRIALNLTGTQTTAVLAGKLEVNSAVAFTTPAYVGTTQVVAGTLAVPSVAIALATAYGMNGAGGGGLVTYNLEAILTPQNDGDLIVQVGSGTGSTQSRLDVGSVLEVAEITFR